jgi:hypothetical protein
MSEYDQRQYHVMLDRLNAFQSGRIQLDTLIGDLRGLVLALERADSSWKTRFMQEWADLEQARATALSRELKQLNENEIKIIQDATARLKLMTLDQIDDPADGFVKE